MSVKRVRDSGRLRSTNTAALLSSSTTVATNAHGGAFNVPWGGSVTIRRGVPHEIELSLSFTAGSAAVDCSYHFLINGVCLVECTLKAGQALAGNQLYRKTLEDLTPGTYTWAIQGAVATAATAYLASSTTNRSYACIRESTE